MAIYGSADDSFGASGYEFVAQHTRIRVYDVVLSIIITLGLCIDDICFLFRLLFVKGELNGIDGSSLFRIMDTLSECL